MSYIYHVQTVLGEVTHWKVDNFRLNGTKLYWNRTHTARLLLAVLTNLPSYEILLHIPTQSYVKYKRRRVLQRSWNMCIVANTRNNNNNKVAVAKAACARCPSFALRYAV